MANVPADYLTQEVCDNGVGGHTTADPLSCPAVARKLRVNEALPYHKWDGSAPGTATQISDSFPIANLAGLTRVVQTEYFDSQITFQIPVFDASNPATGRSGYDLLIADGTYVAAGGTYDPGRGWQPIWRNGSCSIIDSWIYFPKGATIPFGYGSAVTTLNNVSPQCPPNSRFGQSYTGWQYFPNNPYESGKILNTIKTWHFNGGTINAGGIEEFYFTKEYGKTRWEAWTAAGSVTGPNAAAVARCPTGINKGVAVFGSTTYYLVDCHDWSNVVVSATGDWDPVANWHVDPLYNSVNLLQNTHMQCTMTSGQAADCGAGATCQTISPWSRIGNINWGYDANLQSPTTSANCALQLSIPTTYNGQSVYQDLANIPSGYTNYTFGTALWIPPGRGTTAQATVTVFELNGSGNILAQHNVTASLSSVPKYFQGTFTKLPSTARFRFQIYTETGNVFYEFTESWLGPQP